MGQPCLILLRPAPSAVLVRDRGAVARVFPAVLEASEHAPCRAPPWARARRRRRGLALIGALVGRWPGRIVNSEWRVGRGIRKQRVAPLATRYSPFAVLPFWRSPCPRRSDRLSVVSPPFTDFPA